jgi:ribosomal protein S18 acetylase RimI-like enzyme
MEVFTPCPISGFCANNAHFLVSIVDGEILCCVCIEDKEDQAYIGLLVVHPKLQEEGVGKDLLSQVEAYASANLQSEKFVMLVVIQRRELISFYERRGYVRTGEILNYPIHLDVGTPKVVDLKMEYLMKQA